MNSGISSDSVLYLLLCYTTRKTYCKIVHVAPLIDNNTVYVYVTACGPRISRTKDISRKHGVLSIIMISGIPVPRGSPRDMQYPPSPRPPGFQQFSFNGCASIFFPLITLDLIAESLNKRQFLRSSSLLPPVEPFVVCILAFRKDYAT